MIMWNMKYYVIMWNILKYLEQIKHHHEVQICNRGSSVVELINAYPMNALHVFRFSLSAGEMNAFLIKDFLRSMYANTCWFYKFEK